MTKKQELLKAYEEMKEKGIECVTLFIHMPTGETESIVNPNVEEKMKYIDKTYNDDLVHSNCSEIYIEEYIFSMKDEAVDIDEVVNFITNKTEIEKEVVERVLDAEDEFLKEKGIVTEIA